MVEKWTGKIIGDLHNKEITQKELAAEMGITNAWLSMLLNGKYKVAGSEDRMRQAIAAIESRRKSHDSR